MAVREQPVYGPFAPDLRRINTLDATMDALAYRGVPMLSRTLADLLVLVHLGFVAYVVAGGLLALRFRRAPWFHVPAAIWGAAIEIGGWVCPLTPLENRLRAAGGAAGYPGGFIEHYVLPVVYPAGLSRTTQLALGALVLAVNLLIYGVVWYRTRRRTKTSTRVTTNTAATGQTRPD